jgi:hypothetical protein
LRDESADFSGFVVDFVSLSGLCASVLCSSDLWPGFAALGLMVDLAGGCVGAACGAGVVCGGELGSDAGAALLAAVSRPRTANATVSRMAFTGTDLSAAPPPTGKSSSACKIDELLRPASRHSIQRISRQKRGIGRRACRVGALANRQRFSLTPSDGLGSPLHGPKNPRRGFQAPP